MTALNTMVKKVGGLADTKELTQWENTFIKNILERTKNGDNTTSLTEKQIDVLERLHGKFFSG